jgi:tetratricopeptide (TPR) repeat protein
MIVNWRVFGASPTGWHVSSVLLHVAVCLLLFAFLKRLGCEKVTVALIAILFAVHPVHVENIAWISGATDPLLSVFLLVSLILAKTYADARKVKAARYTAVFLMLSVATYLLAVGAKEIALFSAPLYWLIFRNADEKGTRTDHSAINPTLLYVAAAAVFFVVRVRVLGAVTLPVDDPVEGYYAVLSIPKVFVFYLTQIFCPAWLGPALPVRPVGGFSFVDVVLPLAISVAAGVALWKLARRSAVQIFGLALFVLTLLPVLNPGNFGKEQLVHDRYLYLPLAGIFLVIVPAIRDFVSGLEIRGGKTMLAALFAAVVIALGAQTVLYNRAWSDNESLWRYGVTVDPGSAHAWQNLGAAVSDPQEGLAAFEMSLEQTRSAGGFVGKARALIALGRLEDAVVTAREAIAMDPAEVNAYVLFQAYEAETYALAGLKRYGEAESSLRTARRGLPIYNAALTEKLAVILYSQNRKQETLAELEGVRNAARTEYLRESKAVFLRLGMLYAELGRKAEARAALAEYLATTADMMDPVSIAERRRAAELLRQVSTR